MFVVFLSFVARSDDEDDDYRIYTSDLDTRQYSLPNDYYGDVNIDNIDHTYGAQEVDHVRENINRRSLSCKLSENFDTQGLKKIKEHGDKIHEQYDVDECEAPLYDEEATEYEPVDFDKEGLLWIPPEPEDEEDEREAILFDDDDDEGGTGEWGYLRSSNSFGSGEYRNRDKSGEEHRKALKNVVEGHFRALVAQLLQVENLPVGDENDRESWLEIITSLSWEAATLLKPDMSKCGGMDPGEYVKVKCLACGRRSER